MPNRCRSNCFTFLTDGYAFIRLGDVLLTFFEVSCRLFSKGHNSESTNMPDKKKKKNMSAVFPAEPIYKISKPQHAGFLRYGMHKKEYPRTKNVNNSVNISRNYLKIK